MNRSAITYLASAGRPVELAWARSMIDGGTQDDVIAALAAYQNVDGGFGNELEVDIKAPVSQPFAARLAMQVLIAIDVAPDHPMVTRLADWLEREQDEDGCWRFSPGVYQYELAPWFAGWTFPGLNPALCLAGLARQLRIGSERLFARVARLTHEMASNEEIATGEFYALLPYVEYFPWIKHPRREDYLDLLAIRISSLAQDGNYADAGHFFGHVGPAEGELARRINQSMIENKLKRLQQEQETDGGWPSPYSPEWRPWITVNSIAILRDYGVRH